MKPSKNGNIQISVQCHPVVVAKVRAFAKIKTEEQIKKDELKDKKI